MSPRRVVVTGIGAVTSLGKNVPETWSGILSGKSGVKVITEFDTSKLPCKIGSIVSDFEPEKLVPARELRKMDRFIHLGLIAAIEAINDSGWQPEDEASKERTGVMVGSGI